MFIKFNLERNEYNMEILINIALAVIAILLFCLIVAVHEFGHFSMAKLCGVKVNEFAVGMGPKLLKKKKGETLYSLRLFPIGGFCSMEGEDEDSDDPDAFGQKKVWQRILIVSMGAIFNIILGLIMMTILLSQQQVFNSTTVSQFNENSTTQNTGLEIGDEIRSLGGYSVRTDRDLLFALSTDPEIKSALTKGENAKVNMTVKRDGQEVLLNGVEFQTVEDGLGSNLIKIDFKLEGIPNNFINLIVESYKYTVSTIRMIWASLVGIVMGQYGFNDMAGPVGAASAISQSAAAGLTVNFGAAVSNIVYVMIIITVNLGIFNLLPIPALDGGRLVFLIIEGITRKPVPAKYEKWIHAGGFILLMLFMLFITYNDILRLITGKGIGA